MLTPIEIFKQKGKLDDPEGLFEAAQANLNESPVKNAYIPYNI